MHDGGAEVSDLAGGLTAKGSRMGSLSGKNALRDVTANITAINTMDTPFANDPPALADMEQMRTA